jgi:ATP-dependent Zn protease
VSYEAVESGPMQQGIVAKVLANEEGRRAVDRLLDQAKSDVRRLLDENRHLVIALRDALLEHEELVGDEIVETLRAAEAQAITPH